MGFILDGLDTEDYDRQYTDRELLARIVSYFKPYTREMMLVAVMITLNSLAGTGSPILIARGIDLLATNSTTQAMLLLSGGVLLLGVAAWVFNFIHQYFAAKVVGEVVLQLRRDVFEATVQHDMSFFDEHPSGKIVSRITSDTQDFAATVTLTMSLLSQMLLIIIMVGWLFSINVWLTLLLIGMSPLAVAIALSFRRIARRVTQNARRVTATINAQIQESVSGITVAKSFRQETAIYDTFNENNKLGYKTGVQRGLTLVSIFPIMGLASGLGTGMLIFAGGLATRPDSALAGVTGGISAGEWFLFMQAVGYFWWPMMGVASFWSQFQDGLSAAERTFALIDAEAKVVQTAVIPIPRLQGHIQFDHVAFRYTDKEVVLPDFSLDITAGEIIALVGHTGAGKSSIAKLITRFYEFQGGQILVDGRDIRTLDLSQYRQQIGLVPQEPFLFDGSVRDNIRYGLPQATDDRVAWAAAQIDNGDWLKALPHGLDTDVGERGSSLSMGQRQLVALARVILKDPAIFILDEATASVDPFTEAQIQEGLDMIMAQRTAVVIAHRLSTVKNADRIIVMANGRILEEGDHETLLAHSGHYADLYNTYFRHQSLAYIESGILELVEQA
ncbi:MAG: ABC transporter ATP-binding protein [Chloroflexi bacterium]|nr:ABC transporter ATP-binding protein [Chloroflexota bacterium]